MSLTKVTYSMINGAQINVLDYGAVGDGVTDNTTALQAAITAAEAITYDSIQTGHPTIYIPAGNYLTGALTCTKVLAIIGDGQTATFLHLKNGVTDSLFTLNAENIAGTTIDDENHYRIENMTLNGNRTDSTTTGVSHGIYCPATAWSQATQFTASCIVTNVSVSGFTGDGIHLGANRNWAYVTNTIVRYCNDNGLASFSYDSRFVSCEFGLCKNNGVRLYAGGANSFVGCNIYYNLVNIVANSFANAPSWFTNCSIDYGKEGGVRLANSSAVDCYTFTSCRFQGNSATLTNTYSDIFVECERVQVVGCQFIQSDVQTKFLVETAASCVSVAWIGNAYDQSGTAVQPYASGVTNAPAKLFLVGDNSWNLYSGGSSNFGGVTGPFKLAPYTVATVPSAVNLNGAMIYVSDETGGAVPAFSDGTNWRRVTDRAIIA